MHPIRAAGPADADAVTAVITEAFAGDPVWHWAFPDQTGVDAWWRLHVESALRYGWVWVIGDVAAVAVWIPPGRTELSPEAEARVEPLLADLAGRRASTVADLLERFEAAHPEGRPHYYLGLLATANHHRGNGLGMTLLRENLRRIDEEGAAAYLESTNPANDHRYEGAGFRRTGSFTTPDGPHTVTTMWREAVGSGAR